ncbi:MAG: hypothetical protein SRB2_03701 [Desulfobacteraceae bacterium Eth-SRB2]|nr:MAG: hypothetical protein SRB2_03701 [Desulfobacteraceae bacterium Eth-SRB2]
MFMMKKILKPFLLPPGIFIILIIFTGAWILHKKNWKAGIMTLLFGGFAWALSISPVSDAMIRSLESEYGISKKIQGDVIILLGHGVFDEAPDLTGQGAPSGIYLTRIVTAVRLQKRLNIPIIVSGTEVSEDKVIKGHIVKRFLLDLGVPADKIITEDKSRDTFENAKFTQKICARLGFTSPIMVTSAYHLKRAIMSFEKAGIEVLPFPAGFISCRDKQYKWNAYLPGDFRKSSIAISEYLGMIFYKYAY